VGVGAVVEVTTNEAGFQDAWWKGDVLDIQVRVQAQVPSNVGRHWADCEQEGEAVQIAAPLNAAWGVVA
jgi:hypothetical protein